ncbi:response regulator [Intestinibacter bartlettii]|uniref:Response regulator n=1 Tax=Intestinibacter bartlettii TaxID=261299 RepID=A0ABS6DTL4_9FIRM|nr:response regulator [Intestinibacter bartlettii]MBU5335075.1 response regulator [Intestinibacter bartlettii]
MYKILIVEDEYLSANVLELIISKEFKEKVEIIKADNGLRGKQIIKQNEVDLVIMDINIPIINGTELCKYIRIKKNDMPIIVITSDYNDKLAERLFKLEVNEYFIKPVRAEVIIKTIKKYINKNKVEVKNEQEYCLDNLEKEILKVSKPEIITKLSSYINFIFSQKETNYIMKEITNLGLKLDKIVNKNKINASDAISQKINEMIAHPFIYKDANGLILQVSNIITEIFDIIYQNKINNNFNEYTQEAIDYVERNIKKNITLEEVAKNINITPHYLSKIFKKEVGVNFVTYVTDRKIDLAKEMLEDKNIPIVNISISLAFNQPNYFSKVFKKKVGVTPSEYREQCLKNKTYLRI